MLKQDSEKIKQKYLRFALIFSGLIFGYAVWIITGISNFGYYGAERLTERQIIVGWLFLPVCLFSTLYCNLLVGKILFKRATWLNRIFAAIISFNISYFSFSITKDVLIDAGTPLFARADFLSFLKILVVVNVPAVCLATVIFTGFSLFGKLFVRKNLP